MELKGFLISQVVELDEVKMNERYDDLYLNDELIVFSGSIDDIVNELKYGGADFEDIKNGFMIENGSKLYKFNDNYYLTDSSSLLPKQIEFTKKAVTNNNAYLIHITINKVDDEYNLTMINRLETEPTKDLGYMVDEWYKTDLETVLKFADEFIQDFIDECNQLGY